MRINFRFFNKSVITSLILIVAVSCMGAQQKSVRQSALTRSRQATLDHISASSLEGHLSFIASDMLEGRNTPSTGLDTAALYIAAQFRRAGLEPAGDDGYFQTANWLVSERTPDGFELKFDTGKETIKVDKDRVSISLNQALDLSRAPLLKVNYEDSAAISALGVDAQGKAILTEIPDFRKADRSRRGELYQARSQFMRKMGEVKAAVIISIDRSSPTGTGPASSRLIDPENRRDIASTASTPFITVHDPAVVKMYDSMASASNTGTVSIHLAAPDEHPVKLRNVIGILRGSDPQLKDTYVLVTAHYDHIGVDPSLPGDKIFNGANDDGSGTVSVIEIASALATLKARPKRTLVFMTVFGEEKGLLGSRYYGRHPIFPIEKTVADINLEQVGRTDSTEGPQIANASLTGFDYSDVGEILKQAGSLTGITVYKHAQNSDAYFGRSDNQALADQGVPAHTLCVAFDYADYHGAGDHWEKIDYANMAKVDRMVALALIMIADSRDAPKWNEANPKTARYVKAWQEHHGK